MRALAATIVSALLVSHLASAFCQEPSAQSTPTPRLSAPPLSAPDDTPESAGPSSASASDGNGNDSPDSEQSAPLTAEEQKAVQELEEQWRDEVHRWTLAEQFNWAQDLIKNYPNSHLAQRAQRIIDDYRRFTPAAEARRRLALERTRAVRAYWHPQHQQWGRVVERWKAAQDSREVTITNTQPASLDSRETVLFEIRLPGTRWCGPYRLSGGRSSRFFSEVEIRYIDPDNPDQMVTRTLPANTDWVFQPDADREPGGNEQSDGKRLRLVPAP